MERILLIVGLIRLCVAGASEVSLNQNVTLVSSSDSHQRTHRGDFRSDHVRKFYPVDEFAIEFFPPTYLLDENSTCKLHSDIVKEEAEKLSIWALKIIDATAKIPSGILSGNLHQYGDFDECITSNTLYKDQDIKGKYCLTTISISIKSAGNNENARRLDDLIHSHRMFTNELSDAGHRIPKLETFNWGVCIPHSCTNNDLNKALKTHFKRTNDFTEVKMDVLVNENMCFEKENIKFSTFNKIALSFFIIVIALASYATLTDTKNNRPTITKRYLNCFSMKRNISTLLKTDHHPDEITTLHGARFLNATALLLSHKQMALLFNPIVNRTNMSESFGKPWSMIGRSAILYTDSFILMSGLLLSYSLIKELDKNGKLNFKEKFISRIFRFTPNLFTLIIFCTFIMEHLGSGPQWGLVVKQYADLCKRNMWQNFLYIHNYFGFENMCLTHTHQLGIDMQLFIISPAIIYFLWKNVKHGMVLLIALGTASTILRYYVTVAEQISTLIYFGISVDRLWKTASLSYILPTHRLTVYLSGVALGYFLRRDGKKLSLSCGFKWIGWIVSVSLGLLAMFGPYHVSDKNYVYNVKDAAFYNALAPILWTIFISWCIIACENGWGGWFHKFLSWKYFTIFTRISYAIYLTQFPIFFYNVGTKRSPEFYKGLHSMIDLPEFLLIFMTSVAMTVLIDLPFQNLRKTYLDINKIHKKDCVSKEDFRSLSHKVKVKRRRLEAYGD